MGKRPKALAILSSNSKQDTLAASFVPRLSQCELRAAPMRGPVAKPGDHEQKI
jgi:hypothetical protein